MSNPTGTIKISTFNGTTWSIPQIISAGSGNIDPSIAVAPGGTAVATWIDSSSVLQSSIYNGISWSNPTLVSNSPFAKQADVSVSAKGDALVLWTGQGINAIQSAVLPLGGNWDHQQTVGTFSNPPDQVVSALSSSGPGFGVWIETYPDMTQDAFGSFSLALIPPIAPASIQGKTRTNSSAVQIDRLHIINFKPSTDTNVIFYRLRRNGVIIAEIPGIGPYEYIDHHRHRCKRDVYVLTSVNAGGLESTPLTVTLN